MHKALFHSTSSDLYTTYQQIHMDDLFRVNQHIQMKNRAREL